MNVQPPESFPQGAVGQGPAYPQQYAPAPAYPVHVPYGHAEMVPAGYAEKAMASILQLHQELMDEKERRVDLYRRLMEREQAVAELKAYVKMLEDKVAAPAPAPTPVAAAPVAVAPLVPATPQPAVAGPRAIPRTEGPPTPRAVSPAPPRPRFVPPAWTAPRSDGWKTW